MASEDEFIICDRCKQGKVIKSLQAANFRQPSDKGYIRCRVMVLVGVCDHCGARSFDPDIDEILDEAFQREYNKLP